YHLATGPQIELVNLYREPFRPPPRFDSLSRRPKLPDILDRCLVRALDDDLLIGLVIRPVIRFSAHDVLSLMIFLFQGRTSWRRVCARGARRTCRDDLPTVADTGLPRHRDLWMARGKVSRSASVHRGGRARTQPPAGCG